MHWIYLALENDYWQVLVSKAMKLWITKKQISWTTTRLSPSKEVLNCIIPATFHSLSYFILCELTPFPQPSTHSPRRIWPSPQISHLVYVSMWLIPLWQAGLPETIAPDVDWWTLSGQNNAACWGLELCASDLIVLLNVMTMSLSSLGFVVRIAITLYELWE